MLQRMPGTPAGVRHFESHLGAFREHLEVEVSRITAAAQQLTETRGWWEHPQQVGVVLWCGWLIIYSSGLGCSEQQQHSSEH